MNRDLSRRSASGAKADRILEQALKQELRGTAGPPPPDCLDAETLAAWEDGGLDVKAMEAAELHVSNCLRCQSIAAAMASGNAAALSTPAPSTFAPSTFLQWRWWLAPIAAAAAAVTLWMVVPAQQQLATAPPPRDAAVRPSAQVEPSVPAEAKRQEKLDADQAPKDRAQPPAAAALAEREVRREHQTAAAEKNKAEAGKLADQPVASSASADAAAAAPAAAAPAQNTMLQKSARLAFATIEIVSPNSTRRWRIVPAGVEFSTDQGATWIPVRAVATETLTHGVSPSGTICWLIGKDGVVLVTADGSIFAKVDLPVRVDVASITAADARSATVTTVDGRTFRTDDSGRNWRQN
jgi:hypothetical protein